MEEKPRIVILDDDANYATLLRTIVGEGCEVAMGTNGREGIHLCRAARTDLVLLDLGMPEMDGVQMLRAFQKDKGLSAIPVLVVTATHFSRRTNSDVKRYRQVRGIVHKMSSIQLISQEIRRVLQEIGGFPKTQ